MNALLPAAEQVEAVLPKGPGIEEVMGDKGCHSNETVTTLRAAALRSHLVVPDRGGRRWRREQEARDAVYANRRWIRGRRSERLLRCRGESLERPFPHVCETGGMRRVHLRGRDNIRKRLLMQSARHNLGSLRKLMGVGTPRGLRGWAAALFRAPCTQLWDLPGLLKRFHMCLTSFTSPIASSLLDKSYHSSP